MSICQKEYFIKKRIKKQSFLIREKLSKLSYLSDEELQDQFNKIKKKIAGHVYNTAGEVYLKTIIDCTAIICESCYRIRNEMPSNAQILTALALNELTVAELPTGEGKTLAAVVSASYRSLYGKVHIITANDYLTKRDYELMINIYFFLDINADYVIKDKLEEEKIIAYGANVVYISMQEIGFDYLKSNMKYKKGNILLKKEDFSHVIIDEIDYAIIDIAKIPIIIGSTSKNNNENFYKIATQIVDKLGKEYFDIQEKEKDVLIKEDSIQYIESLISQYYHINIKDLYKEKHIDKFFYLDRAMRAKFLFKKNFEYVIMQFKIYIVDQYTGRIAKDRKYSGGIQQAIEAKEMINLTSETQQANYITVQSLFRQYLFLSGTTGTAITEKQEFKIIYNLPVICIEKESANNVSHYKNQYFLTKKEKYNRIVVVVKESYLKKQPVLLGTSNIQESEEIAKELISSGLPFQLLNAKKLAKEADIIANAGVPESITIATNIAGRGTDIKLGGFIEGEIQSIKNREDIEEEEKEILIKKSISLYQQRKKISSENGGLLVIITQPQENRRIDRQFQGRTGRRDERGEVMRLACLEDDIFKHSNMEKKITKMLVTHKEAASNYLLNHLVINTQKQKEYMMFDSRISVLNNDYTFGKSRDVFFELRMSILKEEIDYLLSVKKILKKFSVIISYDPDKFYKIYQEYIDQNSLMDIEEQHIYGYFQEIFQSILSSDYLEENHMSIKTEYLKHLDQLWSNFINSKDIIKRLMPFEYRIDMILDYNKKLCDHFHNIFSNYDYIFIGIIYKHYIHHSIEQVN